MDNIFPYPYKETMFIALVYLSSNTLKDTFVHLRGNMGNLRNYRRTTVSMAIIRRLNV